MSLSKMSLYALTTAIIVLFSACQTSTTDLSVTAISDQTLELRDRGYTVDLISAFKSASGATITLAAVSSDATKLKVELSDTNLTITALTTDTSVNVVVTATASTGSLSDTFKVTLPSSDFNATGSRTTLAHAGLAEELSGYGVGKTLFDSAQKKCQNCHNDLYDTWSTSMHAKAWSDGIFQSKFQDFLRINIAKVGTNPTGSLEYSTAKLIGASKTCIKCHAPAALYSGDWNFTVTSIDDADYTPGTALNSTQYDALKAKYETNLATTTSTFSKTLPATLIGIAADTNKTLYKVTYKIEHENNREGINCATCHSMESMRMIQSGNTYSLVGDMREGPVGSVVRAAGSVLSYDANGSTRDMNNFFRLWGPELYTGSNLTDHGVKAADGRYAYRKMDLNGTNGKKHYTGGPFYGPYGVTGTNNSNTDDETNRTALADTSYVASNNHFSKNAKGLCLSCHQRSAGAIDAYSDGNSSKDITKDNFMELCSTWNAVSNGVADNYEDHVSSPKCTKCHMPRLSDKTVLHQWNKPNKLFPRAELLTDYFDPLDGAGKTEGHNPVYGRWMNDHGFAGGNVNGTPNAMAKIKSGFEASVTATATTGVLTATVKLQNKTAHMFPGAHPMRRVLTRVIVTDANGVMKEYNSTTSTGISTFTDITNTVQPSNGADTVNTTGTGKGSVLVEYSSLRTTQFSGQVADLNGSAVTGQKFNGTTATIAASDSTVSNREVNSSGVVTGSVSIAAITDDTNASTFTRIYGRETGKIYNGTFIVRPGFDSNTAPLDNRLVPNELEIYTLKYTGLTAGTYTVTYKVYYMTKGANGKFLTQADGFLDQTASDAKKFLVKEVGSYTTTVSVP